MDLPRFDGHSEKRVSCSATATVRSQRPLAWSADPIQDGSQRFTPVLQMRNSASAIGGFRKPEKKPWI
jgi:hypothetical protein